MLDWRRLMKNKILEKKMVLTEVVTYLLLHPKWRLPNNNEAMQIATDFSFITSEGKVKSRDTLHVGSEHFKRKVLLVPKLDNCINTGTILYVRVDTCSDVRFNKPYSYNEAKALNLGYDSAMTQRDFIVFVKERRII